MAEFRSGDLLAFRSPTLIGLGIRLGTWAPFLPRPCQVNHVAICALHPDTGRLIEYEATMSLPASMPCLIRGEAIRGLQAHEIDERLQYAAKRGNTVWHFPLARPLSHDSEILLGDYCVEQLGTPYDYWGALHARAAAFGWLSHCLHDRLTRDWDCRLNLGNLFCSEFGSDALRQVCRFITHNPSKWSPAALTFEGWKVQQPRSFRLPHLVVENGRVL